MKFFIAALALVAVVAAQEQQAAILHETQDILSDGSYSYIYEAENGIRASESSGLREEEILGRVVDGTFEYTHPDGAPIKLSYVADENGFHPQGDHLPQGPPIPEGIRKGLEYIHAHPEKWQ